MILPKWEDGFFPEMEDLPLLEVTAETGLWLSVFFLEAVSCIKKVKLQLTKLNMNDNNGQIRLVMKKTFKL